MTPSLLSFAASIPGWAWDVAIVLTAAALLVMILALLDSLRGPNDPD